MKAVGGTWMATSLLAPVSVDRSSWSSSSSSSGSSSSTRSWSSFSIGGTSSSPCSGAAHPVLCSSPSSSPCPWPCPSAASALAFRLPVPPAAISICSFMGGMVRKTRIFETLLGENIMSKISAFVGLSKDRVAELISVLVSGRQSYYCLGLKNAEYRLKKLMPAIISPPIVDLGECKSTEAKIQVIMKAVKYEDVLRTWYMKGSYITFKKELRYLGKAQIENMGFFPEILLDRSSPSLCINDRLYAFGSKEAMCDFMEKCLVIDISKIGHGQRFALSRADYNRLNGRLEQRNELVSAVLDAEDILMLPAHEIIEDFRSGPYSISGLIGFELSLQKYYAGIKASLADLDRVYMPASGIYIGEHYR